MSFLVNTANRSDETEIMDDFTLEGTLFRDTLDKLEMINRLLGGNAVTIKGLKKLIQNVSKEKTITIVDLGCGHGDILREIAKFGRKKGYKFDLIGIDANQDAIDYAEELSGDFNELSFLKVDIFSTAFEQLEYDVVLCTLFAHHFKDEELVSFFKKTVKSAKIGVVVNDLHRHKLAYYLFRIIGLFIKNKMVREDGLTSILRAFKRKDLEQLSTQLKAKTSIEWKWAFRYQWIIQNR
ncbi:MAG: methyltransferase domain-containing protein [Flavobacteriaceae bacterium]|nr:methyltransferase domain-containing protein [Flavobacteriaceae bacterium]